MSYLHHIFTTRTLPGDSWRVSRGKLDRRDFLKIGGLAASALVLPAASKGMRGGGTENTRDLWDRFFLGSAYYPEWWDPTEWETDFRQMHALGFNTVRMGEFAWSSFEPAEGKFEFAWMDKAIDLANHYHIEVILGTPTASVPPWLSASHPDVLGANAEGRYTYGGRKGYCTNSPDYLRASARLVSALAEHYGRHRGVIGWQLDNEPGSPFGCYDSNCEHAFRQWLQRRYLTLDALNRAWNGPFWSNEYSDWGQIKFPVNSAESGWQPAISLDYRRFFSESYLRALRKQAVILREKTQNQFLFTNWPNLTWSVDAFAAAAFLDAAAWDNYCGAPGISAFQGQYYSGFNHDFSRCAGPHQHFFCAEQNAYVPPNALKEGLRLQAYIDLAHGSYGNLYFEWRRPLAGNEQYRPSFVKGFDGAINPAKAVFEKTGKEFARLGPRLAGAVTCSDIALLYDYPNQWSQGFWGLGNKNDQYDQEARRYYRGFKALQRNMDVVPLSADFSGYKLIVAPNLRLVDDAVVKRLDAFVKAGGILVLNDRAGTQNMDNSMRRVLPPGPFADMAGITTTAKLDLIEYSPLMGNLDKKLNAGLGMTFSGDQTVFRPRTTLESITLHGAKPLATFLGGRMAGLPAVTLNRHGNGQVFYAGTDCAEDGFYEALARAVGACGDLSPLMAAPYGIEVTSRENAETVFYFLLNLTESTHDHIALPGPMEELITGKKNVTAVSLDPLGVAVLASKRSSPT